MVEILPIDTPSLGDRSYLAHDGTAALVVDPQRDIDRVVDLSVAAGVHITHVVETHIYNDYVTGGLALSRAVGARYLLNAADPVSRTCSAPTTPPRSRERSTPPRNGWPANCRTPRRSCPPTDSAASAPRPRPRPTPPPSAGNGPSTRR